MGDGILNLAAGSIVIQTKGYYASTLYNLCSVHQGDIMSTLWEIMKTSGEGMSSTLDGYFDCIWRCSVDQRNIMISVEGHHQYIKGYCEYIREKS